MKGEARDPLAVLAELRAKVTKTTDPVELAQIQREAQEVVRSASRMVGADGPGAVARAKMLAGAPDGEVREKAYQLGTGRLSKALAEASASAGGLVVPVDVADEVARAVRARSVVMGMGVRVVEVDKQLDVPAISAGATAYWVAENAAIPVSEQTFAVAATLAPKELGVLVPVSNRLLRDAQTNPDLDAVIRDDMASVVALAQDFGFVQGTGAAGQPLGIRNQAGMTAAPNLGANGATLTFDHLIDTVAALRAVNAPFDRPGWVFHPTLLTTLSKLKDTTGRYLADSGLLTVDAAGTGGTLLGFPYRTTSQIPTNVTTGSSTNTTYLLAGSDWDECWIGRNLELVVETSGDASYTTDGGTTWANAFQNRQQLFRAITAVDIALRRPQFFSVLTGIKIA